MRSEARRSRNQAHERAFQGVPGIGTSQNGGVGPGDTQCGGWHHPWALQQSCLICSFHLATRSARCRTITSRSRSLTSCPFAHREVLNQQPELGPTPRQPPIRLVEGCRGASSRCQIAYAPVSRTVTPDGDSSSSIGSSVTHSLGKSARRTPDESSTSPGPVKVPAEMWTGPSLNHTS